MSNPDFSKIGKYSRSKGQRYERKISHLLNDSLGWNLVRNIEQSRRDVCGDLIDSATQYSKKVDGIFIHIECKARAIFSWQSLFGSITNADGLNKWVSELPERNIGSGRYVDFFIFIVGSVDMCVVRNWSILFPDFTDDYVWVRENHLLGTLQQIIGLIKWQQEQHHKVQMI